MIITATTIIRTHSPIIGTLNRKLNFKKIKKLNTVFEAIIDLFELFKMKALARYRVERNDKRHKNLNEDIFKCKPDWKINNLPGPDTNDLIKNAYFRKYFLD